MTSTPSGKTPDASPSPTTSRQARAQRGLSIVRAQLGLPGALALCGPLSGPTADAFASDRRQRAEALAAGLLELRSVVAQETLA